MWCQTTMSEEINDDDDESCWRQDVGWRKLHSYPLQQERNAEVSNMCNWTADGLLALQ